MTTSNKTNNKARIKKTNKTNNKTNKKTKTKTKTKTKRNKNKTKKQKQKKYFFNLPNMNPYNITELSRLIFNNAPKELPLLEKSVAILEQNDGPASYSPTVNKDLIKLQSIQREEVHNCNNEKAFKLEDSLQIGIKDKMFGKTCVPYYDKTAMEVLLKNLSANKHVNPDIIIPPIQKQANCWFNTMFVTLFVSDKGRKFFHFFRQLMIEGVQSNGEAIPSKLKNGFALLNYAVDACLTGNKYAYMLDTNAIIRNIYDAIPKIYKDNMPYISNVDDAGNPIRYYGSIIHYLHNKSLQLSFIQKANDKWKEMIIEDINKQEHLPHIIILEFFDAKDKTAGVSGIVTNKPRSFLIKGAKYSIDSCVIRDTTQQHFSSTLTCENKEMAYDGMSYHRLVPLSWKKYINSDFSWGFEGSNNTDGSALKWNFKHGYQMLIYYRVK